MKFQGFVGPSYKLSSVNVDAQRCVNLYPEIVESGTGKEGDIAYLKSTPGLRKLFDIGTGPIRMIHADDLVVHPLNPTNRTFVVSGNQVYKCTFDGTTWTNTLLGTIGTSTGPVRAASLQSDLGITVFVDGQNSYLFWRYTGGDGFPLESFGPFSYFSYAAVPLATHVLLLDGYLIYNQGKSNKFFVSKLNTFAVNPLDFASAEGDPDDIVAIITNHRELWLMNERTVEVWYNTGDADFPFRRVSGGFIEKGCVAASSVAKIDGYIFWLGRDVSGEGIVYAANGLNPQRISTHAVEHAIKSYADMTTASAYTYQSGGHNFYVLNFTEGTWVYDLSTKLWHERAYTNAGTLERHRGDNHSFLPLYHLHLIGDYATASIYALENSCYTDNLLPITRMRAAPHVSNGLNRLFCKSLTIDMETGIGLDGSVQGSDPQLVLDYSDDGGHTWSSESWTAVGQKVGGIGDFKKRVIWRRLGKFRDRVFRVTYTEPTKFNILGAQIEVEAGTN